MGQGQDYCMLVWRDTLVRFSVISDVGVELYVLGISSLVLQESCWDCTAEGYAARLMAVAQVYFDVVYRTSRGCIYSGAC